MNNNPNQISLKEKAMITIVYLALLFIGILYLNVIFDNYTYPTILDKVLFHKITLYGIIVGITTITTILFLEAFTKKKLNLFQYGLVSTSIFVGFLLNLSIGNHLGFNLGFIISAAMTTFLNMHFVYTTSKQINNTAILGANMFASYGLTFLLAQSTEYNLLILSLIAFMFVAIGMNISQKLTN